jgi:hypothetical protein
MVRTVIGYGTNQSLQIPSRPRSLALTQPCLDPAFHPGYVRPMKEETLVLVAAAFTVLGVTWDVGPVECVAGVTPCGP